MKIPALSRKLGGLPQWVDLPVLAVIIGGFFAVSLPLLTVGNIDFDEGFSAYIARFNPLQIAYYTALDVHPPLYYWVLHWWGQLFGMSVPTLKLFSLVWAAIALVFGFLIVRRQFGRVAAWIAAPLLAAEPLFFHYAEVIRMYSMATALCLAGTYLLLCASSSQTPTIRRRLWIGYGVIVSAGMWTNYFTALVWIAHLTWIGHTQWQAGHRGRTFRHSLVTSEWGKAVILAIVLYLAWLPALLFRFAQIQASGFWVKPLSIDSLVSTLTMTWIYQPSNKTLDWMAVVIIVAGVITIWQGRRLYHRLNSPGRSSYLLLILSASVPIVGLALMSLPPLASSYVYRYILPAISLGVLVSVGTIVTARFSRYERLMKTEMLLASLVLLVSGCLQSVYIINQNLDTTHFTVVGNVMKRLNQKPGDDPIVILSPYTYFAAVAYETHRPVYYIFSQSLGVVGSTRMLYEHTERAIQNPAIFVRQHPHFWMLAEAREDAATPLTAGLKKGDSFDIGDPAAGKSTGFAVEYKLIQ